MATHDYVIDNSTGANVRADINSVLQAILTNNSSSSAPSTTAAYMWWADTTNGVLKIRNSSNNDWVELFQLDGTLTLEDGSASTPALAFRDDLDTGIYSSAANTFNVATGGTERLELGTTTIFNEDGADVDFRIEGDTEANLFYVDAGNNRIGIGTSSPTQLIHLKSSAPAIQFEDTGANGSATSVIEDNNGFLKLRCDTGNAGTGSGIGFEVDASERMRITKDGHVGIGTTSPNVLGASNTSTVLSIIETGGSRRGQIELGDNQNVDQGGIGDIHFVGHYQDANHKDMAVIRANADGSTSGQRGAYLSFSTKANASTSLSERLRIDSHGHMGLGVTPDDGWPTNGDFRAFQLGTGACVFGRGSGDEDRGGLAVNYYATGSGNKFLANGHANLVYLNDGNINFYTSAQNTSGADADLTLIEVMEIKSNKDVEIKDGDLVIGTAGHGIDFSAQNTSGATGASTSNELLNHYEEGTWTPTTNGGTLSVATAHYVRVGTLVMAQCYVTFPSMSGGSEVLLQGYPFTTPTGNDFYSAAVNSDANLNTQLCGQFASTTMKFATENNSKANFNQLSGKFVVVSVVYSVH